jgi:hypothetical protein
MITAKQANAKTKAREAAAIRITQKNIERELTEIQKQIEAAIDKCQYSVTVTYSSSISRLGHINLNGVISTVQTVLREQGYVVSSFRSNDSYSIHIKWDKV